MKNPRVFIERQASVVLLLAVAGFYSLPAEAVLFDQQHGHLAFSYLTANGRKNASETVSGTGYGIQIAGDSTNSYFGITGRGRFEYTSGSGNFNDGGTIRDLKYSLLSGEGALGIKLNMVKSGGFMRFVPYIGATGSVGVAQLRLPSTESYASLSASEVAIGYGYEICAGFNMPFKPNNANSGGAVLEFQLRSMNYQLAPFSGYAFDGLRILLGMSW